MPGRAGIWAHGSIFHRLLPIDILSLDFHLLDQFFHPAQPAHELVIGRFGGRGLLLWVSGTLGEDAAEIGARTLRAWILLVAFDFSLPTMGAAQGLLRGVPLTGGGRQSRVRRWAL